MLFSRYFVQIERIGVASSSASREDQGDLRARSSVGGTRVKWLHGSTDRVFLQVQLCHALEAGVQDHRVRCSQRWARGLHIRAIRANRTEVSGWMEEWYR